MVKFVALFDAHWGYENLRGRRPLHDAQLIDATLRFIQDFKPQHVVLGGDMLDCGPISHHSRGQVGTLEGLRLGRDADELRAKVIRPLEKMVPGRLIYHIGNHEDWLTQFTDEQPALEGLLDIRELLSLGDRWEVVQRGEASRIGKIYFIHGDQVKGGVHHAKWAVETFERNIRFGHFHTHQAFTKTAPLDAESHTSLSIPCLCRRGPRYGSGSPNRWINGFLYGYVHPSGHFTDHTIIATRGQFYGLGKLYRYGRTR